MKNKYLVLLMISIVFLMSIVSVSAQDNAIENLTQANDDVNEKLEKTY